jgi:hypothetical protein
MRQFQIEHKEIVFTHLKVQRYLFNFFQIAAAAYCFSTATYFLFGIGMFNFTKIPSPDLSADRQVEAISFLFFCKKNKKDTSG